jgi:hypothetical protein
MEERERARHGVIGAYFFFFLRLLVCELDPDDLFSTFSTSTRTFWSRLSADVTHALASMETMGMGLRSWWGVVGEGEKG